jgi:long-chain acyl-CoA synthetase
VTLDIPQPVYRAILAQADKFPEKPAIVSDGRSFSYADLAKAVAAAADALQNRFEVAAGDRVVLLADSSFKFIGTYLATHSIGAVCVPLDPQVTAARLADIVERVAPRLLVAEKTNQAPFPAPARFDDLIASGNATAAIFPDNVDVAQAADVMFTTGTTGRSKGVTLSHRALAVACSHINAFIGVQPDDIEVLPLPLSHSFGLGRVRCVLSLSATLVLVPGFVSPARILDTLSGMRATGLASVPAGIGILLSDKGEALSRSGSQLRYIEIGSSAMPMEQKRLLMNALPKTRVCMHYGLTEASRSAFLSFHDDTEKLESVGRPSAGVEMRIVDEHGVEVRDGIEGQIEVRGGHLMSSYWHDAGLTRDSMRDGWLRTGDLGWRDPEGYYYLKARSSEIINVGGRKVSPQEIEDVLTGHPAVAECACVGIPDPQGLSGEMISAYLVADPASGELPGFPELAKLLRQSLEPYKIPRKFTWIAELPKSTSGKVLRRKLRGPEPA